MYDFSTLGALILMFLAIMFIIIIISSIFVTICKWKVNKRAGRGGWECLIPIYCNVVRIEMAGLPLWYLLLYFIPYANIYAVIKTDIELAHRFNKSTGFGVGMFFAPIVFEAILAFEKDRTYIYQKVENTYQNYCTNCGSIIDNASKYCQSCGKKIEK